MQSAGEKLNKNIANISLILFSLKMINDGVIFIICGKKCDKNCNYIARLNLFRKKNKEKNQDSKKFVIVIVINLNYQFGYWKFEISRF